MTRPAPRVFVVSAKYSGSTVLGIRMARRLGLGTVGEREKFAAVMSDPERRSRLCSCGRPFGSCEVWGRAWDVVRTLQAGATGGFPDFARGQFAPSWRIDQACLAGFERRPWITARVVRRLPGLRSPYDAMRRWNLALEAEVESALGARGFLDLSKRASSVCRLAGLGSPRLLHLVRDPRAVAWSTGEHEGLEPAEASRRWRRLNRRLADWGRQLGDGYRVLRYEDFCADPEGTVRRLAPWLGVDLPAGQPTPVHVFGNARVLENPDAPIWLDRRWVGEVGVDSLDPLARDISESLGYHLTEDATP